jgi:shikimate kinase
MIVALIGYMGSGKSTVGKELAAAFGYAFLDLDDFIEKQEKLSVTDLFQTKGNVEFRKIEAKAVQNICKIHADLVLSLGGGTPCYGNTMQFLNQHPNVNTVYLKLSVKNLTNRLLSEKSKRPLIANVNDADLSEFIAKHLFERSNFYNQAKLSISTNDLSIDQIVAEIANDLDEYNL